MIVWPSNSTPGYIHRRIKSKDLNRYFYTDVHSGIIHYRQKLETTQCSVTDEWINKKWHIYSVEYFLALKTEGTSDIWYKMDKLQRHYTQWNKPDTRTNIVWFHIYERPGV